MVVAYAAAFVAFGLAVDAPADLVRGLVAILTSRDTLTDCFGLGGIGGGVVSAPLLTLVVYEVYYLARARMTGASLASLFLVLGFGLLGKKSAQRVVQRRRRLALCPLPRRRLRAAHQHRPLRRRAGARRL